MGSHCRGADAAPGENLFEVYNGHPSVHNEGDATHASLERCWDVVLTWRLALLDLPVMYGIATDDAHAYHEQRVGLSNAGRGWVMVRSRELTPEHLIRAMEAGDFYASSGGTLKRSSIRVGRFLCRSQRSLAFPTSLNFLVHVLGLINPTNPSEREMATPFG